MTERGTWLITCWRPSPQRHACRRYPSCPPCGAEQGRAPHLNRFGLFRVLWDVTNTSGSICQLTFRKCTSPSLPGCSEEPSWRVRWVTARVFPKRSLENTKRRGLHPKIKLTKSLIRSRHKKSQRMVLLKIAASSLQQWGAPRPGQGCGPRSGALGSARPSAWAGPGCPRSPARPLLAGHGWWPRTSPPHLLWYLCRSELLALPARMRAQIQNYKCISLYMSWPSLSLSYVTQPATSLCLWRQNVLPVLC